MKIYALIILLTLGMFSCQSVEDNINAQDVIDHAIEASGKEKFRNSEIAFNFRDHKYISNGQCGDFIFTRIESDSTGSIKDVYNPKEKLKRYINDSKVTLADSTAHNYAESINSVMYFLQLPYRLNDKAVNKTYKGLDSINGISYHRIAIDFDQKGGGTDYEDRYLYWFRTSDFTLDYLAYSFTVNGGGIRFREAYNERIIKGIRFVDYKNYIPKNKDIELNSILDAFKTKEVELLSKIENTNIKVKIFENEC